MPGNNCFMSIFLPILLGVTVGFAVIPTTTDIAEDSESIINELAKLTSNRTPDACAGDLELVSEFIARAEVKATEDQFEQALTAIKYSQNELRQISYSRPWCQNVALKLKPILKSTIDVGREIERLQKQSV